MISSHILLFSSDLECTLLGNPTATWRFTQAWDGLNPGRRPLLVYNTGHSVAETRELAAARDLPDPDFIIGSVGTELHDGLYNRTGDFGAQFGERWNLELVEKIVSETPGVRPQPDQFLHPFKSSWYWLRVRREEVDDLRRRLRAAGLHVHVDYSGRYFLDVVPARAGKGRALAWLCDRLQIPLRNVLVAGDTANDISMFQLPGVNGIAVQNALPELLTEVSGLPVFHARSPMADGVIEGLRHFGVLADAGAPTAADRRTH